MAEQKPLQNVTHTPAPADTSRRPRREVPKVGDHVWYRLTSNMELVPAEVIDAMPSGNPTQPTLPLEEPDEGHLHLKIALNPRRHFSSGSIGYRRNAPEATDDERVGNTWMREKPEDEDAWFAEKEKTKGLEQQIRRNIALGRGMSSV